MLCRQLIVHMKRAGITLATSGKNLQPVLECIACGFCMNIAVFCNTEVLSSGIDVRVYKLARLGEEGMRIKCR